MVVTSAARINLIRDAFIAGKLNKAALQKTIGVGRQTIRKYCYEFGLIKKMYPDKLADYTFRWPKVTPNTRLTVTVRKKQLMALFPSLVENFKGRQLRPTALWKEYKKIAPNGLSLHRFSIYYLDWRKEHHICQFAHRRVKMITNEDMAVLTGWKNGGDLYYWRRAVVILGSYNGRGVREMAKQLESTVQTILIYIDIYNLKGTDGLKIAPYTVNQERLDNVKRKQDNLVKLIHESPQLHGFNRTSWKYGDLAAAYTAIYNESMSRTGAHDLMAKAGYAFEKSRQVLTSPDKHFREKVDNIKRILSGLLPDEKFFSVDEYGHFGVKIIGGRSIVKKGERVVIPELQKSKGFLIMTAALELSTNQVTHFYSRTKDTEEMIKLILLLSEQYRDQQKLFISWDAAAWHSSKLLKEKIADLNSEAYRLQHHTPAIELAPLPSSAQFLNVIESVFSGMAKAVLHNSNYESVEACMAAIDRHFKERNAHFLLNPRRAGNKIWGEEVVAAEFSESNNCKTNTKASKIKKESYYQKGSM